MKKQVRNYGWRKQITQVSEASSIAHTLNLYNSLRVGSLGVAVVGGKCGGIFVVEPQKYPHIPSLSQRFPKTLRVHQRLNLEVVFLIFIKV